MTVQKNNIRQAREFRTRKAFQGSSVGMVNLGCARNLVDAQGILGRLKKNGHSVVDIEYADIAIVNTCSFIEEAKKESIGVILDMVDLKKQGKIKKVIVAGCLAQRYGNELIKDIEGIDAVIGIPRFDKFNVNPQVSLTPAHYAYVKICESCFNKCSFCAIPGIKGKFSSRTIESVVEEIKRLDRAGVKEVNLIGQDITAYGMDLYRQKSLARLLKEIVKVAKNIRWVRLLYAFPAHVTDELIEVMATEEKICKYIDLPLQHISDKILEDMNRGITKKETVELLAKLRAKMPQGSLRTTFIVGFPGEGKQEFDELVDFIKSTPFERVGVFVYSKEEGTPAHDFGGQVPDRIKKKRLDTLMHEQQDISKNVSKRLIGKTLTVLIDEVQKNDPHVYLGRSEYDAPEVDGLVYVRSPRKLHPGDFVNVAITDAFEYDLTGEVV